MISQFVLEKTNLTPGHINTSLVVVGCMLSGFGIYDYIIDIFHAGSIAPIMNFGHLLVVGASEGYNNFGFIGLFKGVLSNAGAGISIAIVCAFLVTIFSKIKN